MKCVIPNYIPHTVKKPNYRDWFVCYRNDLLMMYDIFNTTISERYDDEEFKPSEKEFLRFCKFIFDCSSKYIQTD